MGNGGKNSNSSQWFFTLQATPQCDGRHVVFGELISGWEVLEAAEQCGDKNGVPLVPVIVTDCGLWEPLQQPGAGFWYDRPDPDTINSSRPGVSPVFVARPRVALVAPSEAVLERFVTALGSRHSVFHRLLLVSREEVAVVANQLNELLAVFAVDVVVVAPACPRDAILAEMVTSPWGDELYPLETIVLTAKPVDAASVIQTHSWLARRSEWQFDVP